MSTDSIKLEKPTKRKLRKLRRDLAAMPDERFDMSFWARPPRRGRQGPNGTLLETGEFNADHCGTAACMAGHVVLRDRGLNIVVDGVGQIHKFTDGKGNPIAVEPVAREILGIDGQLSWRLFRRDRWPEAYRNIAKTFGDRRGAIALLDALIAGNIGFNVADELVEI